jgi:hypothetical protein
MDTKRKYTSYLLRLWLSNDADGPTWRASLEDPHSGVRLGFSSLERLFAFLKDQTGDPSAPDNWILPGRPPK